MTIEAPHSEGALIERPLPRDRVGLALTLSAFALVSAALLSSQPLQSANDRSRWCTVWSLVERGTYQIDEIDAVPGWSTIDKVRHRSSAEAAWHFYSSKPPLLSTAVAGLYWVERHTLGYDLREHTTFVTRLLLLIVNALPFLAALLCLRRSLRQAGLCDCSRWFVLAAAGFGSMLNPFLTTLNNHTPAAICVTFSLAAIVRIRSADMPAARDFVVLGLTAALTCCFELPAALFGLLSFVLVLCRDWRKTLQWYVPAAILPLAAFFVTNWICTGGIKPFYAYYGTDKYVYVHEGVPSYWTEPQGIDANRESPAVYLFHCVLGHHGILSLTPVFLLTAVGWWTGLRTDRRSVFRVTWCLGAGLSVAILIFYLSRTQNYNYGGNSSALRWMLWLTPFWWYGLIPAGERLCQTRRGQILAAALLVPSIYSSCYSLTTPWQPGWIFRQMQQAGWIDYSTKVPAFAPLRYSVLGNIPTSADVRSEWSNGVQRFSLQVLSPIELSDQPAVLLSFSDRNVAAAAGVVDGGAPNTARRRQLIVLPAAIAAGNDVSVWLKEWTKPLPTDPVDFRQSSTASLPSPGPEIVELLRGLPSPRPYHAESPRYLRYTRDSGEKWAVRCDRGAARVPFEDSEYGRCWQRCDVMYCDELPFGVAQWRITVVQESTNTLIRTITWTCTSFP